MYVVVFPVLELCTNVIILYSPRLAFHLVSTWVSSAPVCMLFLDVLYSMSVCSSIYLFIVLMMDRYLSCLQYLFLENNAISNILTL